MVAKVAERYREDGYDVAVEPRGEGLPPFLAGFQVDLIATKADDHVVVEVKTHRLDLAGDPSISRLAEVVNAEPRWRFDLVILEAETTINKVSRGASEPSDEQLDQMLKTAEDMADRGQTPYAHVVAWAGLEAAMRRTRDGAELSGRATPRELLRALYGNGFLDGMQFHRLKESYNIRSQVVHGLVPLHASPDLVRYVTTTARHLAYEPGETQPTG